MSQQSVQRSNFAAEPSLLPLGAENCPTCGQKIPPDKFEEISGRIGAREREQTLAIAAQLEKQHAIEKREADARAKADLEAERQKSGIREERVRDEAQKTVEKIYSVKLAEAEQIRADLAARSQQQLAEAQSAQKSAEQLWANLQTEMDAVRANNAAAIQAIKDESNEREKEIRNEVMRTAESAAAEGIAAIETAQRQSEAELKARISEAEALKITAEQNQSRLASELDALRNSKEAEVAKVKEEAATDLLHVRQIATTEAEARMHDTLAAQQAAIAEAREKASQTEAELLSQREILEKAKEEAVNAEKARAFEENQKLSIKLADLQRAWEKKTAEELGEGAEIKLLEALKKEFPEDKISQIPKGTQGADILHVVMLRGEECGTILYDSKNHKQFRHEHVAKLRTDQLAARAEHAILSTHKFPECTRQLHIQDGVILVNPARAVIIATIVRQHLQQLHTLRLSAVERESKTGALYEFIISERCSQLLTRVDQRAEGLLDQQEKEIKWHENNWKKQGEAIRAIQKAKVDLENHIHSIIGTSANDDAVSEAS
jgi:hypothetical protein